MVHGALAALVSSSVPGAYLSALESQKPTDHGFPNSRRKTEVLGTKSHAKRMNENFRAWAASVPV